VIKIPVDEGWEMMDTTRRTIWLMSVMELVLASRGWIAFGKIARGATGYSS
jgi:hypothetical protein